MKDQDKTFVCGMLCCLAILSVPFVVWLAVLSKGGFGDGHKKGMQLGYKKGYIQALNDIKQGKPPVYVLIEQPDGTTQWEENKEQSK